MWACFDTHVGKSPVKVATIVKYEKAGRNTMHYLTTLQAGEGDECIDYTLKDAKRSVETSLFYALEPICR